MISSNTIQSAYVYLYTQLRKYIWPFDVLDNLVDLEMSVYKAIPTISEIKAAFNRLEVDIKAAALDDTELAEALNEFEDIIQQDTDTYIKLDQVKEVIQI